MALVAMTCAAALAQTPSGSTTIAGRVVDAITGRSIPEALVQIHHQPRRPTGVREAPRPKRSGVTDTNGAFTLEDVQPGEYIVNVSKEGYIFGHYGAKRPDGALGRARVSESASAEGIVVQLWPEATIEGRVTDERGRAVVGAPVRALPDRAGIATATTDDRGMYRLDQLLPGEYRVAVESNIDSRSIDRTSIPSAASPGMRPRLPFLLDADRRNMLIVSGPMPPASADGRQNLYVTSYFGGLTYREAKELRLDAGQHRAGVDITLQSRPAVRVAGTIVGPSGPEPGVVVGLRPEGDPRGLSIQYMQTVAAPSGDFAFVLAPMGRYVLTARKVIPRLTPVRLDDAGQPVVGYDDFFEHDLDDFSLEMPFTIGDTDVTGLSLAIHRGAVVSGKVIRDENGPVQKPAGALIFLSVEKSSERDDVRSAAIAADGTFSFKARPGRYIVIGPTSTSSERLKEVFFNGKNIGDGPFTVGNDPVTGLNVALTERHTKLEGTIRPRADCTVVVFPADRSRWDAIRSNPTRARSIDVDDGAFDVSGLLPGEYFVAAVDDSLMGEWPTRTTLDRLSRLATRVHLSEGTPTRVALTIRNRRR